MPGSATIGSNLVDELLADVDELREDLHTEFGVRQWRVYLAKRNWSGDVIGEGIAGAWTETEITPQPFVTYGDLRFQLDACGLDTQGEITLTEISLTYTEPQLLGLPLTDRTEFAYVLRDAHGQALTPRYYVPAAPPYPDRVESIGWKLRLRQVNV